MKIKNKQVFAGFFRINLMVFWLVACKVPAVANGAGTTVGLLWGDGHSKSAVEVVRTLAGAEEQSGNPGLQQVKFISFSTQDIRRGSLEGLDQCRLALIRTMSREDIAKLKPIFNRITARGGKVFSVDAAYVEECRATGILKDEKLQAYFHNGGMDNLKNMVCYAMAKGLGISCRYDAPAGVPMAGIFDCRTGRVLQRFEEYRQLLESDPARKGLTKKPWIGIVCQRNTVLAGQDKPLKAVAAALERGGFNPLPVFHYPSEKAIEAFFFGPAGRSRVKCVIALAVKMPAKPAEVAAVLKRLDVPVIDAITLVSQSPDEWKQSTVGLDVSERTWQIALPEMSGIGQPTVVAAKERQRDPATGKFYVEEVPIEERIQMLVRRAGAWIRLREKPDCEKRVAVIYYNYPPGKNNVGASYLNVLPDSLCQLGLGLKSGGYDLGEWNGGKERLFNDIHQYARNIGKWAPAEIDRLVKEGKPALLPMEKYRRWYAELPEKLRRSIEADWGPPEKCDIMTWRDAGGKMFMVLPSVQYGKILFTPQPTRGWDQDSQKIYHNVTLAPHHQYVAFYLWLKKEFQADAVVHVGTHGTHEWLPGKEAGLSAACPPEALLQELPNIYPYIVDNVGEGLQAKRRGMATIIDHMTPPFDKAGANRELKGLSALITDYDVALEKSPPLAALKLKEIQAGAQKMGLLTDLGLKKESLDRSDVQKLEHHLKNIAERQTPFGLHTFGRAPEEKRVRSTAEAILALEKGLSEKERQKKMDEMMERIRSSGKEEMASFLAALSGRFVMPAQGNDPVRNPDSLPTGKNFYSFDPVRIPPKVVYEMGAKLARELIEEYRGRHGQYPDKLTFNLWSTETIRNEGVMESQILHLMGIRPKWDATGKVFGLEAIARRELGRPRIDVTIIPSGLYRDLFSNLMELLDKGVSLAKAQNEKDNILRSNMEKTRKMLRERGVAAETAERLASVRLFTVPSGAYGPNVASVTSVSDTWEKEEQVAGVFMMRMSHLYGQGFWGDKGTAGSGDIRQVVFTNALAGTKIAVHGRSSNLYGTLDNDDVFQYLGGTAMAVRAVDGKTPEVYVTEMSNPAAPRQETVEQYMGREMRSRYLNPAWIKTMMREGYAGARFVNKVVENLWGWQVTVPEAVDGAKWNEMYETYVLDRNGLDIKQMFRDAKNMAAYQALVSRMLETVRKGYWKPDQAVVENLAREFADSVKEAGLACCDHTCNNPALAKFTVDTLAPVPGMRNLAQDFTRALEDIRRMPPPSPAVSSQTTGMKKQNGTPSATASGGVQKASGKKVEGYEMKDVTPASGGASAPIPYLFIVGFLILTGLLLAGFHRRN
ncbi:MAG: cobaltochelatase subunit CobN [Verrucomicrobiae bacterium]|nr:cobaltochelatase subunit CobN [Verrucomicrobiae bacterium]